MLPAVALVDGIDYGLPPAITAYTGLDALTQARAGRHPLPTP